MFLLDTCVLSEGARPAPDLKLDAWLKAQKETTLFVSAVTAGELRYGIDRLPRGRRRDGLEQWYAEVIMDGFADRVLPFDLRIAVQWGRMRAAHPNSSASDSQIAATALTHDLTLVTRNVKDFAFAGLTILNPWQN